MSALAGIAKAWTVAEIELRQRVVSRTFFVVVGVFAATLLVLSGLVALGWGVLVGSWSDGGLIFAATFGLTIFLGSIVVPVLSGGSINGDRANGTLATTQLTLVTTWQLVLGKVLSAWLSSVALIVVALPFLVVGAAISGMPFVTPIAATGVLVLEFGVFSALGVAWSGIVRSQVFSIVCTYLTLAMLSVGSPLAFAVGAQLLATYKETVVVNASSWIDGEAVCAERVESRTYARFDYTYPLLATNPYVIAIDALPVTFRSDGTPVTVVGWLQVALREAQVPPNMPDRLDFCGSATEPWDGPVSTPEERHAGTTPTWLLGAALHVVLSGLLLWWAWARCRTPARALPPGNRVA